MRSVLLAGLGHIGKEGFKEVPWVETHFQAITTHPRLGLAACVDSDASKCVYLSIAAAPYAEIAVIATPPATHRDCVEQAIAHGVRGIICEKPIADTLEDARAIIAACSHVPLVIGHQRRYEQGHRLLRAFLQSGALGKILAARCRFSGDIVSNGTHAADVLRFLAGDAYPQAIQQTEHEDFRVYVGCEKGGVELRSRGEGNRLVPGYLHAMYDNLLACMDGEEKPLCSGDDGLEALRAALAYKEMREAAA